MFVTKCCANLLFCCVTAKYPTIYIKLCSLTPSHSSLLDTVQAFYLFLFDNISVKMLQEAHVICSYSNSPPIKSQPAMLL